MQYETQIAIVGSGPAGLAAACTLQRAGLQTLILERGVFAHGVAGWPLYMKMFSTPDLVELCNVPFIISDEATRHQYLRYLQRFATEMHLQILTRHAVMGMEGAEGNFVLHGSNGVESEFEVKAEQVILATGAYDHPNLLGVPGENLPKVSHYYREVNDYIGQKVLVVGGRHSAAEAALELCRAGIDVAICHRGPRFANLKYWVGPDLENRIKQGQIKAYLNARVLEIRQHAVELELLENENGQNQLDIENDAVLALTGYHPNPDFLSGMGLKIDPQTRQPIFDPRTFQSTRPGVYFAGVMLAGNISGAIFIENSRHHGEIILAAIQQKQNLQC